MAVLQCYKTNEASEMIKIERHLFPALRSTGLLTGRQSGRTWIFDEEELNRLVRVSRGFDLGNEEKIKMNAPIIMAMHRNEFK